MEKHYPSWRYHPTEDPRLVNDPKHEKEAAHPDDGWVESPADLPAPEPPDPSYCTSCGQKLPTAEVAESDSEPAAAPPKRDRKAKPKAE